MDRSYSQNRHGKTIFIGRRRTRKHSGASINYCMGKPEPLKHDLTGYWSRRIDEVNRLVYRISDDVIEVIQCRGHYN